ncbi:hypothetical protein NHQ30_001621 [Ciborinia camelliae]|nr:hypothetical protein NHQ30_001621 [Ciborinia camelliae]
MADALNRKENMESLEVEEFEIIVQQGETRKVVKLRLFITLDAEFASYLHTIHVCCTVEGKQIGYAFGRYVRRERMRVLFWSSMEAVSEEMSSIAFSLFDRYGFLKDNLKNHCVRKGTGVWGSELDFGPLFLMERIEVTDRKWRRKGLGRAMVDALVKKAQEQQKSFPDTVAPSEIFCFRRNKAAYSRLHTISSPGWLRSDAGPQWKDKSKLEKNEINHRAVDVSEAFHRSLGFRRIGASTCFGLSSDPEHKSQSLAIKDDFDPPDTPPGLLKEAEGRVLHFPMHGQEEAHKRQLEEEKLKELKETLSPLNFAAVSLSDVDLLKFYKTYHPKDRAEWKQVDHLNNTLLHITACEYKPLSVKWLMDNVNDKQCLTLARNIDGYTPLESLQDRLEIDRTRRSHGLMKIVFSDKFTGFTPDSVACKALLMTGSLPQNLPDIQVQRLKYGCTCGECIGGFLSPRMKLALVYEAELTYKVLNREIEEGSGTGCLAYFELFEPSTPAMKREFLTTTSLRRGFVNNFNHITSCLEENKAPTIKNVLQALKESNERPQFTRMYLRWGNTVEKNMEGVLERLFRMISDQNDIFGDGEIMSEMGDKIDQLKKCRNDHEYSFVAKACGLKECNTNPEERYVANGNNNPEWEKILKNNKRPEAMIDDVFKSNISDDEISGMLRDSFLGMGLRGSEL